MTKAMFILLALTFITGFSPSAVGDPPDPVAKIKQRCEAEWQNDFRMRKYCQDMQMKALKGVADWHTKYIKDKPESFRHKIFKQCSTEWTDQHGVDWRMLQYCIAQQEDAYQKLEEEPLPMTMMPDGCRCGRGYISPTYTCYKCPCFCARCAGPCKE